MSDRIDPKEAVLAQSGYGKCRVKLKEELESSFPSKQNSLYLISNNSN